jgi:hypothetical protein
VRALAVTAAMPQNTPAEIIDKLNKEINAAIAEDSEKWGKVIKFAGIKRRPVWVKSVCAIEPPNVRFFRVQTCGDRGRRGRPHPCSRHSISVHGIKTPRWLGHGATSSRARLTSRYSFSTSAAFRCLDAV